MFIDSCQKDEILGLGLEQMDWKNEEYYSNFTKPCLINLLLTFFF